MTIPEISLDRFIALSKKEFGREPSRDEAQKLVSLLRAVAKAPVADDQDEDKSRSR
jgi:hypothetical protein